jgi:hypothetical protein
MGDIILKHRVCQVPSAFTSIHITTNFSLAFETAYMLKYIDLNGRSETDPWSIRQMAVYQNFNTSTSHSNNLLIRSSDQIQKRISHLVHSKSSEALLTHWTNMHSIYLGTLSHNWGSYISWIDTLISKIDFNYFFTKLGGEGPNRLHFEDLQLLNKGIDVLSQMAQALALNIEVLTLLSQEAARRATIEGDKEQGRYEVFQQEIRTSIAEQSFLKHHVGLLQTFADRRSVQVSNSPLLLPFSSLLGKRLILCTFQLRDAIALQDSNVMMGMNQKTIQETQTMRTITVVALVYLPASFTAVSQIPSLSFLPSQFSTRYFLF